ncbi:hypothetical protein BD309DRAFT_619519 [Dichomitus squalens]|uniref:Uncharacterized protein n=1 Tax=Dichomitus squalens TaxID=114155 RepID=A0A4Q9NY56_9APHY|nr:hypothetical protein BD309DRAFT_619519 [Dichomitus squalens]TBU65324.1 hypothetical protein BD310DRAFT_3010 [Dichomitus squalens]
MYEEVCLVCGRPVLADGRAYCGDECESQDITSPSISTTSSAQPSPLLRSSHNTPVHLSEVPALHPSALGQSLGARKVSHRVRHSESSSSNSSTSWYALDDEHEEDSPSLAIYGANADDEYYAIHPDYATDPSKLSPSFANGYSHNSSSLAYVRRPSTTNHRAMIPSLHRRTSSVSALTASTGVSRSIPHDISGENELDDRPSAPATPSSIRSDLRHGRKSADLPTPPSDEDGHDEEPGTVTSKKRRNRASLPAYFSLLVSTSTTPRSHKGASALSMLSRSLQNNSASPPTPRIANPVLDTTTAFAVAQPTRVSRDLVSPTVAAPRGRSRRRDPDGRSSSSRRSPSRSPCPRAHAHQSAQVRARLDSMEKVADWVAHSPVVAAGVRAARQLAQRRNSSPPPLPKFEKMGYRDSGIDIEEYDQNDVRPVNEGRRGRRRPDELDQIAHGVDRKAPGYGNGRSGILSRERGRTAAVKR